MADLPIGFINTKSIAKIMEDAWIESMKARQAFKVWDGVFKNEIKKDYKISLCTTCMDRLKDLKQTLPKNIESNNDYSNIEFVVLDYGSTKDDVAGWIKTTFSDELESGKLVYYRTDEPKHFDMAHSRNIVFKLASGDIVNNVDADNFTQEGFATFINRCANEQPTKAIFAKSKQLLRGRLGFYKKEFIDILGGYNEDLIFYGHDDADILNRAWELGFIMMPFRKFAAVIPDHKKHQEGNYPIPWWESEGRNRMLSYATIIAKIFKANAGREWGKAVVIKNFTTEVEI